jgi:hypothetical protein
MTSSMPACGFPYRILSRIESEDNWVIAGVYDKSLVTEGDNLVGATLVVARTTLVVARRAMQYLRSRGRDATRASPTVAGRSAALVAAHQGFVVHPVISSRPTRTLDSTYNAKFA